MKGLICVAAFVVLATAIFLGSRAWLGVPTTSQSEAVTNEESRPVERSRSAPPPSPILESVRSEATANPDVGDPPNSDTTPSAEPESTASIVTRIRGRFVDGMGRVVAQVRVLVAGSDQSLESDESGRFRFEHVSDPDDEPSSFRLSTVHANYGARRWELFLTPGTDHDLGDVLLEAAVSITGTVVDSGGAALGAITVQVEEALRSVRGSRFTGADDPLTSVTSAADGTFRITHLHAGPVRLWAGGEGWSWATSDELELRPGENLQGITLVVTPLEPEDSIELVVVDPEGNPVPRADLHYRYQTGGRSGSGTTRTDEQGRYRAFLALRIPHSFRASDPDKRFRPAIAHDVLPGKHDLVLKLGPRKVMALDVRDEQNRAVETFRVSLRDSSGKLSELENLRAEPENAPAELLVPPVPFDVTVEADGFALAKSGPYEPDQTPASLKVELRALPRVRGTVTVEGRPEEGADVALYRGRRSGESLNINGFACRSQRGSEARTTSDEDGRFALTVREAGPYFLRADFPDHAPAELGPLDIDPNVGMEGLELALAPGGAIRGKVLVPSGNPRADLIVGISRGDGHGVTQRTDAQGEFFFDQLTPGQWLVEWRDAEILPHTTSSSSSSSNGSSPELPWNCLVHEGQVTHFDLDLTQLQVASLEGQFQSPGLEGERFRATLSPRGASSAKDRACDLDSEGRFDLEVSSLGPHELTVHGELDSLHHIRFDEPLELVPGRNLWELEVPAGRLRISFGATVDRAEGVELFWGDEDRQATIHIIARTPAAGTSLELWAPAGKSDLVYHLDDGERRSARIHVSADKIEPVNLPVEPLVAEER